jgi:hypothetical protein
MTLYSFSVFNPTWRVHLIWNNNVSKRYLSGTIEKQDKTEYTGLNYLHLIYELNIDIIDFENSMIDLPENIVSNMSDVHIKDMLNWKLLASKGGLVCDMDVLFVAPIPEDIFEGADVGLICFEDNPKKDYIPVSIMYGSASNRFYTNTYNNALKSYVPSIYECLGTNCIKEKNIEEIKTNYSELIVNRLPDSLIFPFIAYPWHIGIEMQHYANAIDRMHKDSIGIHWYGGAPLSQIFNNKINNATTYSIDNTITTIIRRILCHNHNNQK